MSALKIGHVGIRTTDVARAVEWYGRALVADVRFANQYATFMSFDDEHHRIVIFDDGETEERPPPAFSTSPLCAATRMASRSNMSG